MEKSLDANSFHEIGKIIAVGNSFTNQKYFLKDGIFGGEKIISYYRLKIVDIDGSVEYSEIKSMEGDDQNFLFNVFPNPAAASDKIYIKTKGTSGNILVIISDLLGKELHYEVLFPAQYTDVGIPLHFLEIYPGAYVIAVFTNENSYKQKLIIK